MLMTEYMKHFKKVTKLIFTMMKLKYSQLQNIEEESINVEPQKSLFNFLKKKGEPRQNTDTFEPVIDAEFTEEYL